jgi:hypothetical protein
MEGKNYSILAMKKWAKEEVVGEKLIYATM